MAVSDLRGRECWLFVRAQGWFRLDHGQGWHHRRFACSGDNGGLQERSGRTLCGTHREWEFRSIAGLRQPRPNNKRSLWNTSLQRIFTRLDLAGEKPITIMTKAPGDGNLHWRHQGARRKRMVRRAAIRHRSHLQDLCGELQRRRTSSPHRGRSADRCQPGICIRSAAPTPRNFRRQSERSKSSKPGNKAPAATGQRRLWESMPSKSWRSICIGHGTMADKLWEALDSYLWQTTQNPWVILQTVSHDKVKTLLATPDFQELLSALLQHKRKFFSADAWFQKTHPGAALSTIAYFSMEFMLTEALPIYSGGLGNVAGDQMKAASDLGVPVVGVGLLWGQGYFRQDFDSDGNQRALYPVNDPGQLPIQPVRRANGEWLRIQIHLTGARIWLRCWQVLVGRTTLYLLDANDFANTAAHRGITSELYGGDAEMRLKQEIVLGIGGWRLLREIGLNPEVCHLNEGHAAFAVLERARYYMADHHVSFELALTITRAGNMFTTHTAVPAGFDRFAPELCRKHLEHYAKDELAIPMESLLALGKAESRRCFGASQHGLPRASRQRSGQRRQQTSRRGKQADLSAALSPMAADRKFPLVP
jgi:hypothetical protein